MGNRPATAGPDLDPPSWVRWWDLACPVCFWPVPGDLLVDQTWRLVRHLRAGHAYEAVLLAILLAAEPGPDDHWLDVVPGGG